MGFGPTTGFGHNRGLYRSVWTRTCRGYGVGGYRCGVSYREYNPDSAGTRRDECLVGDSRRQVLVDGDKDIEVVQE